MKTTRRKYFDIKKGHYVLFEDDTNSVTIGVDSQTDNNKEQKSSDINNKSVESDPEIQKINAAITAENERYNNLKNSLNSTYNNNKTATESKLNSRIVNLSKNNISQIELEADTEIANTKKQLNSLKKEHVKKLCDLEIEHANKIAALEDSKVDAAAKLATNTNESYTTQLPAKYKSLNESNVHNAKIYLDVLVGEEKILTGMPDFKNAFKDSDLVYGKDKVGYFVLCIDEEDFNKLYKTLGEAGYTRDDIFAVVMTQILDRSEMLKSSVK